MDGLFLLFLPALPGQELMSGLSDLGVLASSVLLAIFSALALVRQVLQAIHVAE